MTPEHAVPEGLSCPACGYEVAGLARNGPCPECGLRLGDLELTQAAARRQLLIEGPRMLRRRLAFWGLAIPAIAAGAAVVGGLVPGVSALAATATLVGASVLLGGLVAVLGPPQEREVRWLLWVRSLHWIHGPWLVIPACAMLAFLIVGIDMFVSPKNRPGEDSLLVLATIGLPLWLGGCLWCLARWSSTWSGVFGLRPWPTVLGGVFMLALWGASVVLGFLGGVLAATGAVELLGGGWIGD